MFDSELIQNIKQLASYLFLIALVYFLLTLSPYIRKKYSVFNPYININIQQGVLIILNTFRYILLAGSLYFIVDLSLTILKIYPLWLSPQYSEGKITSYKQHSWRSGNTSITGDLPVIEFRTTANVTIVFIDKIATSTAKPHYNDMVPVIYSNNDPHNARVDNGLLLTWFDFYFLLVGTIGCLWGLLRLTKANISAMVSGIGKWNA